jgi:sulfur dioxygenase
MYVSLLQMASIEVSLSTTPRRKKNGSIGGSVAAVMTGVAGGPPVHRPITTKDVAKELEILRNAVRDKENVIQRYSNKQHPCRLEPGDRVGHL